jgi:hypothetical protein
MKASSNLWYQLVRDHIPYKISESSMDALFDRCVVAWGYGQEYYYQGHGATVDLTKLYEQYKILSILKGEHNGNSEDSE